jgi:hypothetical protein
MILSITLIVNSYKKNNYRMDNGTLWMINRLAREGMSSKEFLFVSRAFENIEA